MKRTGQHGVWLTTLGGFGDVSLGLLPDRHPHHPGVASDFTLNTSPICGRARKQRN